MTVFAEFFVDVVVVTRPRVVTTPSRAVIVAGADRIGVTRGSLQPRGGRREQHDYGRLAAADAVFYHDGSLEIRVGDRLESAHGRMYSVDGVEQTSGYAAAILKDAEGSM